MNFRRRCTKSLFSTSNCQTDPNEIRKKTGDSGSPRWDLHKICFTESPPLVC